MFLKISLIVLSLSIISACGGGGSDSDPGVVNTDAETASIGGVWFGTITYSDNSQESIAGIVSETGKARFETSSGTQTSSNFAVTGRTFSGPFTGYAPDGQVFLSSGTQIVQGSLSGSFVPKSSVNGSSFVQGVAESTFTLSYDNIYERTSSLEKLADTYSSQNGNYSLSVNVDDTGVVSGSDSDGCVYSGSVSIIDSRYNAYDLAVTIANCGPYSGAYDGLATLADDLGTNDKLIVSFSNPSASATRFLNR